MSVCATVASYRTVTDVSMCYSSQLSDSDWCQYVLQQLAIRQ